jgi:hypothetical protein
MVANELSTTHYFSLRSKGVRISYFLGASAFLTIDFSKRRLLSVARNSPYEYENY